MLHSFLTSGGRPQTTLTNIVLNGNFASGTTGWSGANANISTANNVLAATGTGTSNNVSALQTTGTACSTGKKLYIRTLIRSTASECKNLVFYVRGSTGGLVAGWQKGTGTVTQNEWYTSFAVVTLDATFTGNILARLQADFVDAATANGKVMEIKEVITIDLTEIFGVGLEPTAAQMQRWLDIFSAGWFDTTKSIPKRIY